LCFYSVFKTANVTIKTINIQEYLKAREKNEREIERK
jgi:hypothetical protein